MIRALPSLLAGFLFGAGLLVSGMTQPAKVIGFLDLFGHWDPTLMGVMGGAIAVHFLAYLLVPRLRRPLLAERWSLPTRRDVDWRLLGGAVLFGAGWGLAGYCPGPAVTSSAAGAGSAVLFTVAMLAGMAAYRLVERRLP